MPKEKELKENLDVKINNVNDIVNDGLEMIITIKGGHLFTLMEKSDEYNIPANELIKKMIKNIHEDDLYDTILKDV